MGAWSHVAEGERAMIYKTLAAALCIVALAASCGSDDAGPCTGGTAGTTHATGGSGGGTAGSGGSASACAGVGSNLSPECDACRAYECCTEAQECVAEPECQAWLECEDACAVTDYDCLWACWHQIPASPRKGAYMACKQRSCAQVCGMEACTGPAFNYQDTNNDQGTDGACRACRSEHCCQTLTTCLEDADCEEALECYASCADSACMISQCNNAEHRPYLWKIAPDWACRSRYCLVECQAADYCSAVFGGIHDDCMTCQHDSCCAETRTCSEDVDCIIHALCTRDCDGDAACEVACDLTYWGGGGLNHVREYCLASQCDAECGLPLATCGGFDESVEACGTCMTQSCCGEGWTCGTSAECAGIHICMDACGSDTACQNECLAHGTAAGVTAYQALMSCRSTQCAAQCG
jgi:hypothetical protein